MLLTIPRGVPEFFYAGDTLQFRISEGYYTLGTYTLYMVLTNSAGQIKITGTTYEGDHLISVAAATTANYDAGDYRYLLYFSTGSDRYKYADGTITIKPDYVAVTAGIDDRSFLQKIVDALESAINNRATNEQLMIIEQSCGDLDVKYKADVYKEYLNWKGYLEQEKQSEKLKNGTGTSNAIYTRFI